ncbi:MAG: site-2 protease family protein [Microbacter sp.]
MDFITTLEIIPAAILGLSIHESAHAYTSYRLGDSTAKDLGRVSLNPLQHIDWLGFLFIVLVGFGWAKPVTFNPDNLRNKHRDEILISLAGPVSNLLLAITFFLIARSLMWIDFFNVTNAGQWIVHLIVIWGIINVALFIFNLIPLPPLDGSHVYLTFLSDTHPRLMINLYKYGTGVLFLLIVSENWLHVNLLHISYMINAVTGFFLHLLAF